MTEPNPDINFELNENGEIAKIIINSSGSGWDEIFEKMNEYARNLPIPIPKKKLMNNNYIPDDDDVIEEMLQVKLTEEKKEELERMRRRENILVRFNNHYNLEMSSLPHGTTLTPEHMQAVTLECAISSLRCENMNVEYDMIAVEDIENLIEGLYRQSNEFLNRVKEQQEKTK
jgi:acyl-CoA thioesterase